MNGGALALLIQPHDQLQFFTDTWTTGSPSMDPAFCHAHIMTPAHPWQIGCGHPHANAFDAKVNSSLDEGTYVDPVTGNITFQEYAEDWRKARTHGETTGISVEHAFRLHVYSHPDNHGRSRRGGPALGHHRLRDLAKRPSLVRQLIAGMDLADSLRSR